MSKILRHTAESSPNSPDATLVASFAQAVCNE